jgi:hypothetical protein
MRLLLFCDDILIVNEVPANSSIALHLELIPLTSDRLSEPATDQSVNNFRAHPFASQQSSLFVALGASYAIAID